MKQGRYICLSCEQRSESAGRPQACIRAGLAEDRFLLARSLERIIDVDRNRTVLQKCVTNRVGVVAGKTKSK